MDSIAIANTIRELKAQLKEAIEVIEFYAEDKYWRTSGEINVRARDFLTKHKKDGE